MMTNSELIRLRRQMHLRIREVVAERRLARQHRQASGVDANEIGAAAPEQNAGVLVSG